MPAYNSFAPAYASLARVATPTAFDTVNGSTGEGYPATGVMVVVDVTAVPGSAPSVVPTIQFKDDVSGKFITLLTGAAITAVGTYTFIIYPGIAAAGEGVTKVSGFTIPANWRINMTHGNGNSVTYSVSYAYLTYN